MKRSVGLVIAFLLLQYASFAQQGFSSVTPLNSMSIVTNTGETPQSKVWYYGGKYWAVLTNSTDGTSIFRLDGTSWVPALVLASGSTAKADVKVDGNVAHIFTWKGTTSYLYSVEYNAATSNYQLWTTRKTRVSISLDNSVKSASIDLDANGRMWLTSDGTSTISVRWSDAPYSTWSSPIVLATGTSKYDLSQVINIPGANKIGVFWSNENTQRFGFKTHNLSDGPSVWSADEAPCAATAQSSGTGFADYPFNLKATQNGTIYAAIKTNYNSASLPQIALLVRRPNGAWDANPYTVTSNEGNTPLLLVNETIGKLKVVYALSNSLSYKESSLASISFGVATTLISGSYDNPTSSKIFENNQAVIIASSGSTAASVLATDPTSQPTDNTPPTVASINRQAPATNPTSATSLTYRVTFSEPVSGVDGGDFQLTTTGSSNGTIGSASMVGTDASIYDVAVSSVSGSGTLRVDLKSTGTGIADIAGNAISGGYTSGQTFTIQQGVPTLTSVTIASNNTTTSVAIPGNTVTLSFTASEAINAPTVTVATHSVSATAGANNSYTATYTLIAGDAEGVVPFTINFSNTVGTAGSPVSSTTNGSSITFDKTVPTATSIVRSNPTSATTNATSVTFRITFSEAVTGVDASDFQLTTTGSSTGSITAASIVGANAATYDITVSSVSGSGTIRADLKSSGTGIADIAGNSIAAGFTGGEIYTIQQGLPTLTSVTIASNNTTTSVAIPGNTVTLSFTSSEAINAPTVTIATHSVSANAGANNSYTATYTLVAGDAEGVVPFTINFSNTVGTSGSPVSATTNSSSVTFDKTVPTVTSIIRSNPTSATTNATSVTFRITFSEAVTGVDASDFQLTTTGSSTGSIAAASVVGANAATYDITISSVSGSGTIRADLKSSGTGIADIAGNSIAAGFTAGETYTIQQGLPTLSSVSIASNNATPSVAIPGNTVTLSFTASEAINPPTVTIATRSVNATAGANNSYTATYTLVAGDAEGVVPFTINFTNTVGTAGSPVSGTTNGSSVTYDKTAPGAVSIVRSNPTSATTNATAVTYRITFNEPVSGVDAPDFHLTTTGSVTGSIAAVSIVGTDAATYDVTVNAVSGSGTLKVDLKTSGTGIIDVAGNSLAVGYTAGETYTIQQGLPTLSSVSIVSNNLNASLAKLGDIVTLNFTASETINPPTVTIATHSVAAVAGAGNSFTATYSLTNADLEGIVPFTINFTNTVGTAGSQVTASTNGSTVTYDRTVPLVSSINRFNPSTQLTNATTVVFRVTFSESVNGVDAPDFSVATTGATTASIASVSLVVACNCGVAYDVTVTGVSGNGTVGVNLKSSGTGIIDVAGNAVAGGFTTGETYTVQQSAPVLSSVGIVSNNAVSTVAKTGNEITLSFTASEAITTPVVTIATHSVSATAGAGNSYTAKYTMVSGDVEGTIPFTINFTSTNSGVAGAQVTTTTNGSSVVFDKTLPVVSSINRLNPATASTTAATVTFQATFTEAVSGVDASDFLLTSTGSVTAVINSVTPVSNGTPGITYDIVVGSITGSGTLRLDLASSGTGIADAAGNFVNGGYTSGQVYTIEQIATPPAAGFTSVTPLSSVDITTIGTKDKPQAKVWFYSNKFWCVLPSVDGTRLYRLDGSTWTPLMFVVKTKAFKVDCRMVGNLVHVLVYRGAENNSNFFTLQYDAPNNTYKLWTVRPTSTNIVFPAGSETATIAVDGANRLWACTETSGNILTWWSDYPYTSWSSPYTIATGVKGDDICAIVPIPALNKIGIFWSNQNTGLFGFKTHVDGASPTTWSSDEMPNSSQAITGVGGGFADDHMNLKTSSDGTVYCAAKTSYNSTGYPKIILMIRRPNGVWDNLYPVTTHPTGTQPIVILNEAQNKLKVFYATTENGGFIEYKESSMTNISFSDAIPIFNTAGRSYDYTTSMHDNYSNSTIIMATDLTAEPYKAVSMLCTDGNGTAVGSPLIATSVPTEKTLSTQVPSYQLKATPNPFSSTTTLSFTIDHDTRFEINFFDAAGKQLQVTKTGWAKANQQNQVSLNGSDFPKGVYMVNLKTDKHNSLIKIMVAK